MGNRTKDYRYEGSAYTTAINVVIDLDESSGIEVVTVTGIPKKDAAYIIDIASGQGLAIKAGYDEETGTLTASKAKSAAQTAAT